MEFDYIIEGSIFVPEDDLNEMAKQVKRGVVSAEEIVGEYTTYLDDDEFYNSDAFAYKIADEVRRRARLL